MASNNRWQLLGNVGRPPEFHPSPDGQGGLSVINLATTDRFRDRESNEWKEHTEWHRIVFTGKLALTVRDYVKKGRQLFLAGSLRTRKWSDKEGATQYTLELRCDELDFIGSSGESSSQRQSPATSGPQEGAAQRAQPQPQQQPLPKQQPADAGGFPGASGSGDFPDFLGGDQIPFR